MFKQFWMVLTWHMSLSSLPRQEKMDKKAQHKIIQCLKAFMNNKVILVLNVILLNLKQQLCSD